jgi:predicted kinase
MQVILMSGISGAGKDTYIRERFGISCERIAIVCSADDFFQKTGSYIFEPSKLGEAHGECLRKYIDECHLAYEEQDWRSPEYLVVNNTNLTAEELAPYVAIANAYGHKVEIVTLHCDPKIAAERSLHVRDINILTAMQDKLNNRILPKYWNVLRTFIYQ